MIVFKEIEIIGLFGESDVTIPVLDNRVVLVGYNGIGKSTILNIFYYFISQQWHKLSEMDFETISLRLRNKNRKLTISRVELTELHELRRRDRRYSRSQRRFSYSLIREATALLNERRAQIRGAGRSPARLRRDELEIISEEFGLSFGIAEDLIREVNFIRRRDFDFEQSVSDNVSKVDEFLTENLNGRILYLPTYRRIEKDIKTIFPEIEEEIQRKLSRRGREPYLGDTYIELVQFGMEDVKSKISALLESVKAYALTQINSLTTRYLRDVIRNEANKYEEIDVSEIGEEALRSVFSKVDSAILSDDDKDKIAGVVEKIRDGGELLENEKYVGHYVRYLVEVGRNISDRERPIVDFIKICNSYLYGKSFTFDSVEYSVSIEHGSGRPVEMEELSSGEKQVVSLFSHLILDHNVMNYIVIDEPELSLSVDWQQRLLEDISKLDTCIFIGAVTHSPFIFENSLDHNTIDLLEHTRESV